MNSLKVLHGPESDKGVYFYCEPLGFGSIEHVQDGESPLSTVEVEQMRIGIHTIVSPPTVTVESADPQEVLQLGLDMISDACVDFIDRAERF